jgi:hypothetical protein
MQKEMWAEDLATEFGGTHCNIWQHEDPYNLALYAKSE